MQPERPMTRPSGLLEWAIPWHGNTSVLTIKTSLLGRSAVVFVDGVEQRRLKRPTEERPWAEIQLDQTPPTIVVAQLFQHRLVVATRVFVDGVCLDDGLSLEAWRSRRPPDVDRFDRLFRGRLMGPAGPLTIGLVCALPMLAELPRTHDAIWAAGAAGAFLIAAGWTWAMLAVADFLRTRRDLAVAAAHRGGRGGPGVGFAGAPSLLCGQAIYLIQHRG